MKLKRVRCQDCDKEGWGYPYPGMSWGYPYSESPVEEPFEPGPFEFWLQRGMWGNAETERLLCADHHPYSWKNLSEVTRDRIVTGFMEVEFE